MLFKKNKILNYGPVLAILVCFLFFFSNFAKAAAARNYQIGLPQKSVGIDKIEYLIDGQPQGSTSGFRYKSITSGSKINFLVKFNSFYAESKIGDFKIVSESGVDSFIKLYVYDYDTTGNIITREVNESDNVDPNQTYITSSITVTGPEVLEIVFNGQRVKKDIMLDLTNIQSANSNDESLEENTLLSDTINVNYYYTVNGTKQQGSGVQIEDDGNITLKDIPYDSTVEIEALAKDGYKFQNFNIKTANFADLCQVTTQIIEENANNQMTIKLETFQIKDNSETATISFSNISKEKNCLLNYDTSRYFNWYEPVKGKENTIKKITTSSKTVPKGKYVFYVRHEPSKATLTTGSKIITLNGAEIDPTFDENGGFFEKYEEIKEDGNSNSNGEIKLNKGAGGTIKHDFKDQNNGEYYKFEVYLTGNTSTLSFQLTSSPIYGIMVPIHRNHLIEFDESYTEYATKPEQSYVVSTHRPSSTIAGTYGDDGEAEFTPNEKGFKKFGFSRPNIYFVPTTKVNGLKTAITKYESGVNTTDIENYTDYLATYRDDSYKYTKSNILEPRVVVLGPVESSNKIPSHFIKFPSSAEGATLSVDTSETVKKCTDGYVVRCAELTVETSTSHSNKFTFNITKNIQTQNETLIATIGSESFRLDQITDTSSKDNIEVSKSNNTYTFTITNLTEDLEINVEKYTTEQKLKEIKFNCPGLKIIDKKDVSYNFSNGGTASVNKSDKEYKFKTELKEGFELEKDDNGQDIPLTVKINGSNETLALGEDGYYKITWEENNDDAITVDITGTKFKSEKPTVEVITNLTELEYYHYITTEEGETQPDKISTINQNNGNIVVSDDNLTPGKETTFYVLDPNMSSELNATILGSATTKLTFKKVDDSSNIYNEIKAKSNKQPVQIFEVTISNFEESCKISIYKQDQSAITHYWTLTKSFEIIPNINPNASEGKVVEGIFDESKESTVEINYQKDGSDGTFKPSPDKFNFNVSSLNPTIYTLENDKYDCKFYSDKELTKEIDLNKFQSKDNPILSSEKDASTNDLKWKIDISNRDFESSIPATSEYISVKGEIDYTKKVNYVYEKIYVGVILKPTNQFNIHFSYNLDGNSDIINYSKPIYSNYKGIRITNITAEPVTEKDNGQIITYKITDGTEFDPKTDTLVTEVEKSFAISLSEGFLYDDVVVSSSKIESVPTIPQENTALSRLFKYPVISDLGSKDSFRIDNVYSKDVYVHVKNLRQRQLKVGFPEQYMEGTDIHLLVTDDDGNTTEKNSTVESFETATYGETLKIRSRAKEGYKADEISEFILYAPNGVAYTFIYVDNNIIGPDSTQTEDSSWTVRSSQKLSKIVDQVRYKFSIDRGELVFDVEFQGIKSNFDVQLRRKKKNFTISFPAQNNSITVRNLSGEEIDGSVSKSYKDSFSFSITPATGVDITNIVVKDTDENVYNLVNGYYTISSVEKDITIKILGIGKETRTITFTDYDDLTYLDSSDKAIGESVNVEYGSSYEFTIDFGESISQLKGQENAIKIHLTNISSSELSDDQIEYDYKSRKCVVKNLTENSKITIDGITLNTYTLTFNKPDTDNVYYTDAYSDKELTSDEQTSGSAVCKKNTTHGSNFSFRVAGKEGVDLSNLKVWLKKSENDKSPTQIVAIDNIYTVENIQGNYIVYTSDSKPTVYTVEIRTTTGVSCLDRNGNTIAAKTEVNYGDALEFRLSIDKIYDKSNPVVEIKGTTSTLSPGSDGYYKLENITEDKILQITGITKNTYKVTFEETEGVIYKTVKNKPFEKSMDVEYGDTLQFKITLMDAYDSSVPTVLLNNTAEISANAGIYKVEGINSDVAINVKNVKKNPEERAIEEITTVSSDISSSSDVDEIISATNSYNNLSDDQKELVTNLDELNAAQKSAGIFNHSADGITVTGIDWYIKLIVTSLNDDEKAIEELNGHLDRKELINLYDIKLYDMLKNEVYKVPYGQEVTVTIPCPGNISEYENIMVIHENSAGGIEYLDVNIKSDQAQFKTTSFSKFGIAGKKIPLDSSKLTNATVSVSSLVENEDELKSLLGENAASEIGELINTDDNEDNSENSSDGASKSSGSSESQNKENLKDKAYNWAVKNELPAVIIVLILGFGILALILIPILKKKSNDKQEKK